MEVKIDAVDDNGDLARRRKTFAQRRSLSEYGVTLPNQPVDSFGIHPKDDKFRFFKKGRDFQPRTAKHHFTEEELKVLVTYESNSNLPSNTEVYKKWLESVTKRGNLESWLILSLVSLITGTLAFVMRWICERFQIFSYPFIIAVVEAGETNYVWLYYTIMSCTFAFCSSVIIVFFCPFAGGSGLPEIIGILNGCVVRNVLDFKTLICKIGSIIFTVLSRLPVGFEGPMIHIGALVGAFMARPLKIFSCFETKSKDFGKDEKICGNCNKFPTLCRYRDCQERYLLIIVGAASGLASAFSSPISGLIFAMEEISSHWSNNQTWKTFVCCIIARSTTEILRSVSVSLLETRPGDTLHIFRLSESALFDVKKPLELSFYIFIPTIIIGTLGGLLGALFVFSHLKMSRFRRKLLTKIKNESVLSLIKVLEVMIIACICSSIIIFTMPYFACKNVNHNQSVSQEHGRKSLILKSFKCNNSLNALYQDGNLYQRGDYNEGASLLFGSWEQMIRNLFSRKTTQLFSIPALSLVLGIFWIFSSYTSMTSIACGLLIPQLVIGALYGRLLGEIANLILTSYIIQTIDKSNWEWVDPGAWSLLGSASFLCGVSRLPITSVVMMIEMTNDINMALLIMVCVMLAKFIGDRFTHSLYHSLLEYKCIPYLDTDLTVYYEGKPVSMELFSAEDIMKSPVHYVNVKESVKVLSNLLLDTNHGAFPVVQSTNGFERNFLGIITRLELTILLTKTERFDPKEIAKDDMDRIRISYPEYSSRKLKDTAAANAILNKYSSNVMYKNIFVNLLPYTNMSAPSVPMSFSLYRTYTMFTALGLRHLLVTDELNQVVGMITRKDLLGYAVESKIKSVIRNKKTLILDHKDGLDVEDSIHIGIQSTIVVEEEEDKENMEDSKEIDSDNSSLMGTNTTNKGYAI